MADFLARNYRAASPERTTWGGQNGFLTVFLEADFANVPFMAASDVTYLAIHEALAQGQDITDEQAVYKTNAEYNYSRVMEVLAQKGVIVTTAFVEGGRTTPALGTVTPYGFNGTLLQEAEDGTLAGADALAISVLVERADVYTENQLPTYTHPAYATFTTNPLQEVITQFVSDASFFRIAGAISQADGTVGVGTFDTDGELIDIDYTANGEVAAIGTRAFVTNVVTPFI